MRKCNYPFDNKPFGNLNFGTIYLTIPIILILLFINFCTTYIREYDTKTIEIAKVISAEACGEYYKGMYGVGNVIANRAKLYNKTPYEVITQKNQFYGYTAKNKEELFNQCRKESLYIAKHLMTLEDITKGALYFKRPEEKLQAWHTKKTITIKNHEFWK